MRAPFVVLAALLACAAAHPAGASADGEACPLQPVAEPPGARAWCIAGDDGHAAGVTIDAPLEGRVTVEFAAPPGLVPKVDASGRGLVLYGPGGREVFVSRGLDARDAAGREVPARWDDAGGRVLRLELILGNLRPPVRVAAPIARAEALPRSEPKPPEDPAAAPPPARDGPPPVNDTCAGAEPIPAAGPFPYFTGIHDLSGATSSGDPSLPYCQTNVSRSVWFSFTPAASDAYTIASCAGAGTASTVDDTVIAVYASSDGTCGGALTQVAGGCDDDSCGHEPLQAVVGPLTLNAGTRYFVVVHKYGNNLPAAGNADVQLRISGTSGPPANDTCAGAEPIPAGAYPVVTSVTPDISQATSAGDPAAPSCQPDVSRSIWYTFTPDVTADYEVSTCAAAPTATTVDDTVLAVYTSSTGSCAGAFTPLAGACDDDGCESEAGQARLPAVRLAAGTTYYVIVHQKGTAPPALGNTAVQVRVARTAPPPANDECAGATPIPDGPLPVLSPVTDDISAAGLAGDPPRPSCQTSVSRSVWYRFTPSVSGSYEISSCASDAPGSTVDDTVITVYTSSTGTCGGVFAEVTGACDDDSCGEERNQGVIGAVYLAASTPYFILVHQNGSSPPAAGSSAVQVRVARNPSPPPHDTCAGAEPLPAGPYPAVSSVTPDITYATSAGDPVPACQENVSRGLWYRFTPAESGRYTLATCAGTGTATTVDDTVLAVYASSTAACGGTLTELEGGCDDDACATEPSQGTIRGLELTGGTTYFVVVSKFDAAPPAAGNTALQLKIERDLPPPNDGCAAALPLQLDRPQTATTRSAADDYRLAAGADCFSGVAQTPVVASGRDAVFTFTPAASGRYSFRTSGAPPEQDAVLYVAADCPAGVPPLTPSCLAAANRNTSNGAEEVACLPLAGGTAYYVYADAESAGPGDAFAIEVNRCRNEPEPNDAPAAAGEVVCDVTGSIDPRGDVDYFRLGAHPGGARVFALVDGVAADGTDFDLRVTTAADTLEYDDANNDRGFGTLAPNAAGTVLPGGEAFLQVGYFEHARVSEPYRVHAAVQPPASEAVAEAEPNDAPAQATAGSRGYFAGALADAADVDHFSVTAGAGDLLFVALDADPARDGTPFDGALALLDAAGVELVAVDDGGSASWLLPGTGDLAATSPASPGEALTWRARTSGTYLVRVATAHAAGGDYLLSIAVGCTDAGPDTDGDGVSDAADCAPHDGETWTAPAAARDLRFAAADVLEWSAPAAPGGTTTRYDLLRSADPRDFGLPACVAQDTTSESATDAARPARLYAYLVRTRNPCGSSAGAGTDGVPRAAGACP